MKMLSQYVLVCMRARACACVRQLPKRRGGRKVLEKCEDDLWRIRQLAGLRPNSAADVASVFLHEKKKKNNIASVRVDEKKKKKKK